MQTVPVRLTFKVSTNGRPELRNHELLVNLYVPDEALEAKGSVKWRFDMRLTGGLDHQEAGTVYHVEGVHPNVLEMDCDDIRATLESGEPGTAVIELPLVHRTEKGKEFIRDSEGRPQAVVERQITTVAFDHGQVAA